MNTWYRLPEWIRWVLCWPVIFGSTILVGGITYFFTARLLNVWRLPIPVAKALFPALTTFISGPVLFFLIYQFVPRKPNWVTGFFLFLSTTLGVLSAIRWVFEISGGDIEFSQFAADVLQTITAVGVSWYWFLYFKREH